MNHNPVLYIMQGVPGSGKTTLAKKLMGDFCWRLSTDDYFLDAFGNYQFNASKLGEYHQKNLDMAIFHMKRGESCIIDNTNILRKNVKPYVEYAVSLNIPVVFIRVTGNFQSIHGVPQKTIDKMKTQMQDLTVESVLNS